MNKGIYLVANKKSEAMCRNLIYSIRQSGCQLPIRLIHFGGEEIDNADILNDVEFLTYDDFPSEARSFVSEIRSVLTDCPLGFLYRFLAWFSDWDEFIYTDNDVVALCNWEVLFEKLEGYDVVHADEEYTTEGRFNYHDPGQLKAVFGEFSLLSALTAGHIVIRKNPKVVNDMQLAIDWFKANPSIPKKHDQSLIHVASLIGKWKMLNLCKPPHNWLSSWAGDYPNTLSLILSIQANNSQISHLHYSGGTPTGNRPIQELLFSSLSDQDRSKALLSVNLKAVSGYSDLQKVIKKVKKKIS